MPYRARPPHGLHPAAWCTALQWGLLNEKMSNKKKTQVTNSVKRPVDPISTELGISCMSISAENNTRIEKEERQ